MNIFHGIGCCLIAIFLVLLPASAANSNGWTTQAMNDEFIVSLPSDWSYFSINTIAGPATGLMDNADITNVIGVQTYNNTNCSEIMGENLAVNLQLFNQKAGIANLSAPVFGPSNTTEFGKSNDGAYTNVYLGLVNGTVIAVLGSYGTMEDAQDKAEQFFQIATSVTPLYPASNEYCITKSTETTPVPTVINAVQPTQTPNSPDSYTGATPVTM